MSLDSTFLRSIRRRDMFKERVGVTPLYLFEEHTRGLVKKFSRYFKEHKSCELINKDDFLLWHREVYSNTTDSDYVLIGALLADFECPTSREAEEFLTERLRDSDVVYRTADIIERWSNGDEIEVVDQLKAVVDAAAYGGTFKSQHVVIEDSFTDILAASNDTSGFKWSLPILSEAMRPAQAGDMILVAARPDSGKTTFLCHIIQGWIRQLDEVFPGEERCILHLNNEGMGSRIKLRNVQVALGLTLTELSQLADAGEDIEANYNTVVGDASRLVIVDIHGCTNVQVERIIQKYNPGVVVWDMLDKVKYVSEGGRDSRTDEYLEGLYSWVREMGVVYKCVNVVSTQLSGDAENMQYPHLGMLKDSKTGKQGTADAIITFGSVDTYPRTRFIGLTKNKLNMGRATSRLGEVVFDGARGLITMPEVEK